MKKLHKSTLNELKSNINDAKKELNEYPDTCKEYLKIVKYINSMEQKIKKIKKE